MPFPAAYFFPIGCVERGDTDSSSSSSTSGVNSHDGEEVVADRIDSRRTQARWLGRIRVCPPVDIVGRGGESRVAVGSRGRQRGEGRSHGCSSSRERESRERKRDRERDRKRDRVCNGGCARVLVHYLPRCKALKANWLKGQKEPHPAITKSSFLPRC